jgi:hypothetical protein
MDASRTNQNMQHAEMIAFMFAFVQIILALGIFLAFKTHIV